MDGEPRFVVAVTLHSGAQARIRTRKQPVSPAGHRNPGTLFWIGDDDGLKREIAGGALVRLDILAIDPAQHDPIDGWPDRPLPDATHQNVSHGVPL